MDSMHFICLFVIFIIIIKLIYFNEVFNSLCNLFLLLLLNCLIIPYIFYCLIYLYLPNNSQKIININFKYEFFLKIVLFKNLI